VRWRCCTARAFPTCGRPFQWCHIIVHWLDGGPTNLDNLAPLCSHHHHHIHDLGYTMTSGPSGDLTFRRPDGTPIATSVDLGLGLATVA